MHVSARISRLDDQSGKVDEDGLGYFGFRVVPLLEQYLAHCLVGLGVLDDLVYESSFQGFFLLVAESELALPFYSVHLKLATQHAQFADQLAFSVRSAPQKIAIEVQPPHYFEFPLAVEEPAVKAALIEVAVLVDNAFVKAIGAVFEAIGKRTFLLQSIPLQVQVPDYAYSVPQPCRRPQTQSPVQIMPWWCILPLPLNLEFLKAPRQQVALGSASFLMALLDSSVVLQGASLLSKLKTQRACQDQSSPWLNLPSQQELFLYTATPKPSGSLSFHQPRQQHPSGAKQYRGQFRTPQNTPSYSIQDANYFLCFLSVRPS